MPVALTVDIVERDGETIAVRHVFFSATEGGANDLYEAHKAQCAPLRQAEAEDRIIEETEDIDELPSAEADEGDEEEEEEEE